MWKIAIRKREWLYCTYIFNYINNYQYPLDSLALEIVHIILCCMQVITICMKLQIVMIYKIMIERWNLRLFFSWHFRVLEVGHPFSLSHQREKTGNLEQMIHQQNILRNMGPFHCYLQVHTDFDKVLCLLEFVANKIICSGLKHLKHVFVLISKYCWLWIKLDNMEWCLSYNLNFYVHDELEWYLRAEEWGYWLLIT